MCIGSAERFRDALHRHRMIQGIRPSAEAVAERRMEFALACHALAIPSIRALGELQCSPVHMKLFGSTRVHAQARMDFREAAWPGYWLTNIPVGGARAEYPPLGMMVGFHAPEEGSCASVWISMGIHSPFMKPTPMPGGGGFKIMKIRSSTQADRADEAVEIMLDRLAEYAASHSN